MAIDHWPDRFPTCGSNPRPICLMRRPTSLRCPSATGEAELARELIQTGHARLGVAANSMQRRTAARTPGSANSLANCSASSSGGRHQRRALRRHQDRAAQKARRLFLRVRLPRPRPVDSAFSRPGVFSHRHIDPGAGHLIDALEMAPDDLVLTSVAAGHGCARRRLSRRGRHRHAVDCIAAPSSAPPAARRAGASSRIFTTELNAGGNYAGAGSYDLALANPPYYAGFRIARRFLTGRPRCPPAQQQIHRRDQAPRPVRGALTQAIR